MFGELKKLGEKRAVVMGSFFSIEFRAGGFGSVCCACRA